MNIPQKQKDKLKKILHKDYGVELCEYDLEIFINQSMRMAYIAYKHRNKTTLKIVKSRVAH